MHLYSFILEYMGGTYISQIEAIDHHQAIRLWLMNLDVEGIENFSLKDKSILIKDDFEDEDPTPLNGLKNIWFFLVHKKGVGYVNFVKTKKL